ADGFLLTVGYVILGANKITVTLPDQRQFPGRIVCIDFRSGLAVLQIPATRLPAATLGDSAQAKTGDTVVILASTDRQKRQGSTGFISAIRPFDAYWEYMLDQAIFTTAINGGFGGGPLVNMRGQVIGIVSLNLSSVSEASLAIPIDLFHAVKEEVYREGRLLTPPRPWLGCYTETFEEGVVVVGVIPHSPAHQAGLRPKDVILHVEGVEVSTRREFYLELWKKRIGEEIALGIFRDEEFETILVRPMDRGEFYQ
ncbi:MAG: serine protease, partial [Nitrospinota bacterium]